MFNRKEIFEVMAEEIGMGREDEPRGHYPVEEEEVLSWERPSADRRVWKGNQFRRCFVCGGRIHKGEERSTHNLPKGHGSAIAHVNCVLRRTEW